MIVKTSVILKAVLLLSLECSVFAYPALSATKNGRPNILWIFIEDASCHISCYGEKAIQTPNIDALAAEGILFQNAFVTAPVCSPSRSALVTGMYQTTLGAHNHRSQVMRDKGSGNTDYYASYELPLGIELASKLFEKAGYYTSNENIRGSAGKQDYNFVAENIYSGTNWKASPDGVPFFSQIQLHGGKNRKRVADTEDIDIPPYYADDDVMREDWKRYLGSWLDTDQELEQIVTDLKSTGVYDNTLIFFLTDHGISHLRGKQFLYDEGIKVPLIVKLPRGEKAGSIRKDLVMQIDLLPSSLAMAGISIPQNIHGQNIFDANYESREFTFAARDRCDETTEIMRSVRSAKFKYIRNFLSYRPHAQRNQYKDGKQISKHMRQLFESGDLNELQARIYQPSRPPEELYDLENDPFEINNLAKDPNYESQLLHMRKTLYTWMDETNDPGLIPEPWLEELGKRFGSKYAAMRQPGYDHINGRLIELIESGEHQNNSYLQAKMSSNEPSERYWAVTWLGVNRVESAGASVEKLLSDPDPSVRIAANLALFKINPSFNPIPGFSKELENDNVLVGMYAMNAMEQSGIRNEEVRMIAERYSNTDYEFTNRFARYLAEVCK